MCIFRILPLYFFIRMIADRYYSGHYLFMVYFFLHMLLVPPVLCRCHGVQFG